MANNEFISHANTLERLAKLETHVVLKFKELDTATILARELAEKERDRTKRELDYRLSGMNEFQKRMDKLEGTFATREMLQQVEKIVYIGIGIVIALQFAIRFLLPL